MTDDESNPNDEIRNCSKRRGARRSTLGLRHSFVLGRSQFVIYLAAADAGEVTRIFLEGRHNGFFAAQPTGLDLFQRLENSLVVPGHYLDEFGRHVIPGREDFRRASAMRIGLM